MSNTSPTFDFARFLNVRRAYGPSFSPDGQRLAFISDITGIPQAYAVPIAGGWPEQLTFTNGRVVLVAFSPSSDQMLVATDVGGNERTQLSLLSAHGETLRPLTTEPMAIHTFGCWSPDGRAIAYAGNQRDPRVFDIYVQEIEEAPAASEAHRVLETDGIYQVENWSPDGRRLVVAHVKSSFETDLFELDLSTGQTQHLTPHRESARFSHARYSADGRSLYLLTDRDSDVLVVARLDLETLVLETVVDRSWDVEDLALSPDGRRLAYTANVEGYSELLVLDLETKVTRAVAIPRGVIARGFVGNLRDTLDWSYDGTQLAFSLTTPRETQNVWIANVEAAPFAQEAQQQTAEDSPDSVSLAATTNPARRLTEATQAAIPPQSLVAPELIRYPSFDQREIPTFLYVPDGAEPDGTRPAIVLIHGGPESQIRPGFDATIQYFVHRGYVVMTPNVRGSTGYGKVYSHLDDIELRMDAVADAKAAADWLADSGWAHRRRIAAMGQSYGGFMVLANLAVYPETWAAGIDIYGIANFVTLLENTHPFRRRHREAEYGRLEQHRELLTQISPLTHVEDIVAPLLVIHGENDLRVPISESEQIVAALEARGVPVEFIRLPDEGHAIAKLANRLRVYPAIADFLERHLHTSHI